MDAHPNLTLKVGDRIDVSIEKIAHGGHFIARYGAAVIFVRHAIPGEEVQIEISSTGKSFIRADVVEVRKKSPDRVIAPCSFAHRQGCGGCDFQHISPSAQRRLKAEVIKEQFIRIAKMEVQVEVEEVSSPLHWRTRFTATSNKSGDLGFYKNRSHSVLPVSDCRILVEEMDYQSLSKRRWKSDQRVEVCIDSHGQRTIATAAARSDGAAEIVEGVDVGKYPIANFELEVSQKSFWQSNKEAPKILTEVVREFASPRTGDHLLDLYGGVGLFTASLIELVGDSGRIDLVEGSKSASADALVNFKNFQNVGVHTGSVERILPRFSKADVVVLDPPREGAGKEVIEELVKLAPRRIVYVACDPAALARDTGYLKEWGYSLSEIRAFDLFPMTQHIECVALFISDKI